MTPDLFQESVSRIDARNRGDSRTLEWRGRRWAQDELYGRRMSEWLERLKPQASQALRLAVRAQHLARFEIPRNTFPAGREGYLAWRRKCQQHHVQELREILTELGHSDELIERACAIVGKKDLKRDPEAQTLEDCACLVFLEDQLEAFAEQHDEEKLLGVLRKTWRKMSRDARNVAGTLRFSPQVQRLLNRALE